MTMESPNIDSELEEALLMLDQLTMTPDQEVLLDKQNNHSGLDSIPLDELSKLDIDRLHVYTDDLFSHFTELIEQNSNEITNLIYDKLEDLTRQERLIIVRAYRKCHIKGNHLNTVSKSTAKANMYSNMLFSEYIQLIENVNKLRLDNIRKLIAKLSIKTRTMISLGLSVCSMTGEYK
jgi:hypothetical protein